MCRVSRLEIHSDSQDHRELSDERGDRACEVRTFNGTYNTLYVCAGGKVPGGFEDPAGGKIGLRELLVMKKW